MNEDIKNTTPKKADNMAGLNLKANQNRNGMRCAIPVVHNNAGKLHLNWFKTESTKIRTILCAKKLRRKC